MRTRAWIVLVALTPAMWTRPSPAQSAVTTTSIAEDGVVGRLFLPTGSGRHPAVIVIGGAEGGLEWTSPWGVPLSERGFVVLALAYFGTDPLPARLQSIPLEYFSRAVELLRRHPGVDQERLGLMGFSKGAEGALLVAATHPAIRAVVAAAPSHVSWPGITGDPRVAAPSWTRAGAAVPFVPYDLRQGVTTSLDAYTRSLDNAEVVATAAIRVEDINGPVLLISGTDDRTWPATMMAESVIERLRRHNFRFRYTHLRLDGAGHAVLASPVIAGVPPPRLGGTPEGNRRARVASASATMEFLEWALIDRKGAAVRSRQFHTG